MGFFSNLGSAISSGISSIGSAISTTVKSIGITVASYASTIAPIIGAAINALPKIGAVIANVAQGVLQAFGIIKPNEKIEEMGERALQAAQDGITPEKFDDFEEYIEELRNYPLDTEIANKRSSAEKIVSGVAIGTVGLEKILDLKSGEINSIWLLPLANADYFNADKLVNLLEKGQINSDIGKYLENDLNASEARNLEKSLSIDLSKEEVGELYQALDDSKKSYQDLAKEVEQKLS